MATTTAKRPQTNSAGVISKDRTAAGPRRDGGGGGGMPSEETRGFVPVGGIVMYSGLVADIPANWALCDGSGGTPNLVDRFVLGTATEGDIGDVGGTAQHKHALGTLDMDSVSAGTPAGAIDAHTSVNTTTVVGGDAKLSGPATHTFTGAPLAGHKHTLSGKTADAEDGAGSTADVLPPWLKLAFIQRIT